jgi:YHS domain-containing protein
MSVTRTLKAVSSIAICGLLAGVALRADAQDRPAQPEKKMDAPSSARVGDPYYLATCPISGAKLGSMGDPVVKVYDGREVRFCCSQCPPKFEKDLKASLAALDEKIIKDQAPLYPLKTSVVGGKDLPAKPVEFVYGNRLVRVSDDAEKAAFLKNPKQYLDELDKAVIAQQSKNYALNKCVVSDEALGHEGKPADIVVGGRLIRMCCKDCKGQIDKAPGKYVAMVDDARGGKKPEAGKKDEAEHKHGG